MTVKQGELISTYGTPGPWTVGHPNLQDDTWFHRIFFADNRGMYEVAVVDKRKRPGADADAALIASAPDLLAACKAALEAYRNENYDDYFDGERLEAMLEIAIEKAEGKQ